MIEEIFFVFFSSVIRNLMREITALNSCPPRVHHVSELRFRDVLLVGLYYTFKLLCHNLHLVGFQVSFKYQIKHQIFLVPTKREANRVIWINQKNFYHILKRPLIIPNKEKNNYKFTTISRSSGKLMINVNIIKIYSLTKKP